MAPSSRHVATRGMPRWLEIHLLVSRITTVIMFFGGTLAIAFGDVLREDLQNDTNDRTCDMSYIKGASEPWEPNVGFENKPGRYHAECRLLVSWACIVIAAGSISLVRLFLEMIFPHGAVIYAPAYSYGLRCGVSLASFLLYLSGSLILGRSPLIIGQGVTGVDVLYCLCLVALCLFTVATAQQTFAEGQAAWLIYQRQIARQRNDCFDERLELQPVGAPEESTQHHDNDRGVASWEKSEKKDNPHGDRGTDTLDAEAPSGESQHEYRNLGLAL